MGKNASRTLELVIGDLGSFDIFPFDDRDVAENLAGITRVRLQVMSQAGGTAFIDLQTGGGGLTIDVPNSKIVVDPTAATTWTLTTGGLFIGQMVMEFDTNEWKFSDDFHVNVSAAVAVVLP